MPDPTMTAEEPEQTPADLAEPTEEPGAIPSTQDHSDEPYGAQVVRNMHRDCTTLLEDYDEMAQVLEHEGVSEHLQAFLESIVSVLEASEELFEEHYGENSEKPLPPLDNAGGKDLEAEEPEAGAGTEPEQTDSGTEIEEEEDEPTPDEAVEGMSVEKKSFFKKAAPKGRVKTFARTLDGKALDGDELSKALTFYRLAKGLCPECGEDPCTCPGKKALRKDIPTDMGVEEGHVPGEEADDQEEMSDHPAEGVKFLPHHRKAIGEGHDFLQEASESDNWEDEHRHKAYHHHKSFDGVLGDVLGEGFGEKNGEFPEMDEQDEAEGVQEGGEKAFDAEQDVAGSVTEGRGKLKYGPGGEPMQQHTESSVPGGTHGKKRYGRKQIGNTDTNYDEGYQADEVEGKDMGGMGGIVGDVVGGLTGGDDEKSMHPHVKAIKAASGYFKELSQTKNFGDPHRQQAMEHLKALDPVLEQDEAAGVTEPEQEGTVNPGEMGEKASLENVEGHEPGEEAERISKEDAREENMKRAKDFLDAQDDQVEITDPASPSKYKPGKEPMQQHTESLAKNGVRGKTLQATLQERGKKLADLNRKLELITSRL